jgi:hypothetical protein
MEVASQGRVGTEGGGEAVVFDTSQFFQNVYNMQKDIATDREKKRKEYEQQQATWNSLLEDPGDVWQSDYEYVNKAVNAYNDFIIDLKTRGIDPDTMDASLLKKMKQLESEIRKATSASKDNETYYNQSFNILNQDKQSKYNKNYATEWLREYADPSKTPQDRSKMRNESNPFKLNYDLIEFVDQTIPEPEVSDTGRKKITSRNKEAHRSIVFDYVTNDPKGQEIYESLKKPGETVDLFAERVAEEGQKKYPVKTDVQPAPSGRGGGGGGKEKKEDKVEIVATEKVADPKWTQEYDVNAVSLGKLKPPVYVYADDGTPVMNFIPDDGFYLRPGNTVAAVGYGTDEDGKQIRVEIDYEKNKRKFNAAGYPDMYDYFVQKIWGGGSGSAASTSTGKTYTGIPTGGF